MLLLLSLKLSRFFLSQLFLLLLLFSFCIKTHLPFVFSLLSFQLISTSFLLLLQSFLFHPKVFSSFLFNANILFFILVSNKFLFTSLSQLLLFSFEFKSEFFPFFSLVGLSFFFFKLQLLSFLNLFLFLQLNKSLVFLKELLFSLILKAGFFLRLNFLMLSIGYKQTL